MYASFISKHTWVSSFKICQASRPIFSVRCRVCWQITCYANYSLTELFEFWCSNYIIPHKEKSIPDPRKFYRIFSENFLKGSIVILSFLLPWDIFSRLRASVAVRYRVLNVRFSFCIFHIDLFLSNIYCILFIIY